METQPNNSAFPDPARSSEPHQWNQSPLEDFTTGISIRVYIATKAMQGILANAEGCYTQNNQKAFSPDQISQLAVQSAECRVGH